MLSFPRDVDVLAATVAVCVGGMASLYACRVRERCKAARIGHVHLVPTLIGGPVGWLLGHLPELQLGAEESGVSMTRHVRAVRDLHKRSCPEVNRDAVGVIFPGTTLGVAVLNPRDVEYVLLRNGSNYEKSALYDSIIPLLGASSIVVLRDESKHTVLRRQLNPAFSAVALQTVYDKVVAKHVQTQMLKLSAQLTDGIAAGVDVEHTYDALALDIVSEAAFRETSVETAGSDHSGSSTVSDYFRIMADTLLTSPYILVPGLSALPWPAKFRLESARDSLRAAARVIFARAISPSHAAASDVNKLLVDYLADAHLDPSTVADNMTTVLLAGHETSSTTLTWLSYLLAKHPDVQQSLFEELSAAVQIGGVPSLDTVRNLSHLHNCVREALRLYPPVTLLSRVAVQDDCLPHSGVVIPKGTEVIFYVYCLQRDPLIWGADADSFRPDRWNDPSTMERVGLGGFLPFFLGKRNCIGKDFAMNELLATTAVLVRRFKLEWTEGQPEPYRQEKLTMRPKVPIAISLRQRTE